MIGLIDCNNFFVSCERVFRPDLRNKPVAVLSSNDGCVIARSNEVKALGVKMGVPHFKVKELFERHQVQLFSTNFRLYGDLSQRVMNTIRGFSPHIETYSIDEAFIDLSGFEENFNLRQYGAKIRAQIYQNLGIPTCVGIAPSKTLAKIANHIAKKFPQLQAVHLINSEELRLKALKWTPIEDVWGIGRQSVKKLNQAGVHSAYDLTQQSDAWVQKILHQPGLDTKRELLGIPAIDIEHRAPTKQSIGVSRTFAQTKNSLPELETAIVDFTSMIAQKMRKQQTVCKRLTVYANNSRFAQASDFVFDSEVVDLPIASSSSIELIKYAKQALTKIYKPGIRYKRAGVTASKLTHQNSSAPDLFDTIDREKHDKIMTQIDKLNRNFGSRTIQIGSESKDFNHSKSSILSPNYTTEWDDIMEIKL